MKKRILAIAFCLTMIFTAMGYMGIHNPVATTADAAVSGTVNGSQFLEAKDISNTVTLSADTTVTSQIEIKAGETLTIDLNGYVLIAAVPDTHSLISCKGTLNIKSSDTTRAHYGSMEKVTRWIDKRTNYSTYGSQYNNTDQYYDRYIQVTTTDEELWKYNSKANSGTVIKGGIITGAFKYGSGAVIYVDGGTLNFQSGTLAGNNASRKIVYDASTDSKLTENSKGEPTGVFNTFGGAVYATNGATINMSGGTISYNWADYYGGAVCLNGKGTTMNMTSGMITDNCAQGSGGGIGVRNGSNLNLGTDGSVDYSRVAAPVISYNKTFDINYMGGGGGIEVTSSTLNYKVGSITNNRSSGSGAGIYCYRGGNVNASTSNSVITNNYAGGSGGAIFLQYGDVNLDGCVLNNNESKGSAGAVGIRVGNFNMTGGEIKNNTAGNHGGAVYVTAQNNITPHGDPGNLGCSATIDGTVIEGNKAAQYGGAVYVNVMNSTKNCTVDLTNCQIKDNVANERGGAAYICGGTLTVDGANTVVQDNTSPDGGAFYVEESNRTSPSLPTTYVYKVKDSVIAEGWKDYDTLTADMVDRIIDPDIALKPAIVNINAGQFKENKAINGHGGAFYVTGTKAEVYMNGGNLSTNTAAKNGGAIYIRGGNFTMKDGEMSSNTATGNGGATYVSGGNFTVKHGVMNDNEAINGGAAYINGGDFIMESGTMSGNAAIYSSPQAAENGTEGYGGAVNASGGNIYIGIEDCKQSAPVQSHKNNAKTHHPIVTENTAAFGGGLSVNNGKVYVYCCNMTENVASSNGAGMNIFMNDLDSEDGKAGEIHHYMDGAEIGEKEDHGMVSIGGTLEVIMNGTPIKINLLYNSNYGVEVIWKGEAPEGYYLNLPYCPSKWSSDQDANGFVFAGWSDRDPDNSEESDIRSKDDYNEIGKPVLIKDLSGEGSMDFYAVWAPKTSDISYAYSIDNDEIIYKDSLISEEEKAAFDSVFNGYAREYEFTMVGYNISGFYTKNSKNEDVPRNPTIPGYKFIEWKMYASPLTTSNWGADAKTYNQDGIVERMSGLREITAGNDPHAWAGVANQNFGDIVVIAVFEPQYCDLDIIKSVSNPDEDQSFLFAVEGTPYNTSIGDIAMNVVINNDADIVDGKLMTTLKDVPVGNYTVTEITDWSWRYDIVDTDEIEILAKHGDVEMRETGNTLADSKIIYKEKGAQIKIDDPSKKYSIDFPNVRERDKWLADEAYHINGEFITTVMSLLKELN